MIQKTYFLKELEKVKLVIGNGFDLYCGLKTSYSDFFKTKEHDNNTFNRWFAENNNNFFNYINNGSCNIDFNVIKSLDVWTIYFFILMKTRTDYNPNWWDVEKQIENSLKDSKVNLNWNWIYKTIKEKSFSMPSIGKANKEFVECLAAILISRNGNLRNASLEVFYEYLLAELKKFERNFARYICSLHNNGNYTNSLFKSHSEKAIEKLCNKDNIVSVDSFNFDNLEIKELDDKLHHINGDFNVPIFGVDSSAFGVTNQGYIFTKSYRRMEKDMNDDEIMNKEDFENVVIFGCSMQSADYSYFFAIFDTINIIDVNSKSKIVFAFNVYDSNKADIIKSDLRKTIFNLFYEYSKYKGNNVEPNRLLDALTSQGKIILYEISK